MRKGKERGKRDGGCRGRRRRRRERKEGREDSCTAVQAHISAMQPHACQLHRASIYLRSKLVSQARPKTPSVYFAFSITHEKG